MKIEKKKLVKFLEKVQMSGSQQIMECILDFTDAGLNINADCASEQSKAIGLLKPSAFKEYSNIGKIGVNDFNGFIGAINRFDNIIELKQEGNVMIVNEDKKKVEIELINTEFITSGKEAPNLEFNAVFKVPPKKMQSIFTDANLSKDAVIKIETATNQVKIENTGKYKFTNIFDVEGCVGGVKAKYGEPLVDAISRLTDELIVSISTDYPIQIEEKNEESEIKIIVAPRIEGA